MLQNYKIQIYNLTSEKIKKRKIKSQKNFFKK